MATSKKKVTPKSEPVEWETALTYATRRHIFDNHQPVLTSVPHPSGAGWEPVSMKIIRDETYFAWVFLWKRRKE